MNFDGAGNARGLRAAQAAIGVGTRRVRRHARGRGQKAIAIGRTHGDLYGADQQHQQSGHA